jgi:putative acetyltransferase
VQEVTGQSEELQIAESDPQAPDVLALIEAHLAFARGESPPEHVHAMAPVGLTDEKVTLFGARRGGLLLGIGAIREIDSDHAEIKSMHTAAAARRQGVGRAVVDHLLEVARDAGYRRVSLETGTMEAFSPARALYKEVGFETCAPFGNYTDNPFSTCMTILLSQRGGPTDPQGND